MIKSVSWFTLWVLVALAVLWWLFPGGALLWLVLGGLMVKVWFWITVVTLGIRFVRDVWGEKG